jgi:hypothetical protein
MTKEQIIDEAYENFEKQCIPGTGKKMTKEEFINFIKTQPEFSERLGLMIEERELSREERIQIYVNQYMGGVGKPAGFEDAKLATRNIPTKLITIIYNNETIESYE